MPDEKKKTQAWLRYLAGAAVVGGVGYLLYKQTSSNGSTPSSQQNEGDSGSNTTKDSFDGLVEIKDSESETVGMNGNASNISDISNTVNTQDLTESKDDGQQAGAVYTVDTVNTEDTTTTTQAEQAKQIEEETETTTVSTTTKIIENNENETVVNTEETEEEVVIVNPPVDPVDTVDNTNNAGPQQTDQTEQTDETQDTQIATISPPQEEINQEKRQSTELQKDMLQYTRIKNEVNGLIKYKYKNGSLKIIVHQGADIVGMDKTGTSDPYVKIIYNNKKSMSTKSIDANNNPVWNEQFVFKNIKDPVNESILFEVYDKDAITANDFIGSITIPIIRVLQNNGSMIDEWLQLINNDLTLPKYNNKAKKNQPKSHEQLSSKNPNPGKIQVSLFYTEN